MTNELEHLNDFETTINNLYRDASYSMGRGCDVSAYADDIGMTCDSAIKDYCRAIGLDGVPAPLMNAMTKVILGIYDYPEVLDKLDIVKGYIRRKRTMLEDEQKSEEPKERTNDMSYTDYNNSNVDTSITKEMKGEPVMMYYEKETFEGVENLQSKVLWTVSNNTSDRLERGVKIRDIVRNYVISYGANEHTEFLDRVVRTPLEGSNEDMDATLLFYKNCVDEYVLSRKEIIQKELEAEMNEPKHECDYCGKEFRESEMVQISNGNWVCEDCYENHYYTCDICGEIHYEDETTWIEASQETVCESCLDRYFARCESCGEYHRTSDMTESDAGDYYCESCYSDRFTTCNECGCEVMIDDYDQYYDEDGYIVCEECYDRIQNRRAIHEYHDDDVEFDTNIYADELITENTLTIGIEHEVGGDRYYASGFADIVNDRYKECNVALFRDSSVDGFEIVSMPMTIEYFKKTFIPLYRKGLEYLKEHGFKGHNEGGIHIHFSEMKDHRQIAKMCNILYGSLDDINAWCKITKRDRYLLNKWCSMSDREYSTTDIIRDELHNATDRRHTALNYDGDRTYTHELRIFNSTLDIDEYMTCVEVLLSLLDFTSTETDKGLFVNTRDYVNYIRENREVYTLVYERMRSTEVFEDYGFGADIVESEEYELTYDDMCLIDAIIGRMDEDLRESEEEERRAVGV